MSDVAVLLNRKINISALRRGREARLASTAIYTQILTALG
jgi:hypothetical protein